MDSSPSTSLEGSWRSESYMPFASSSSSAHPYAFASSSKARSHTYPSGSGSYDYQHDHGSHEGSGNGYSNGSSGMGPGAEGGIVNQGDGADHADAPDGASGAGGSGALRDEASSAWSSSLPTPTSARSEPYKAGSSSTWPRYRDTLSGDSHWRTHQHHPSASSSSHPARDMATNGRADDTNTHIINGHAFPGTGYPLVPPIPPSTFISGHPPTESHGIGKGTAVGKGKGKGKAVEREHEDTGMSLAGRIEVWAKVMDTSKGRDKVLKCGQYSMRTYLYLLTLILRVRPLPPWFTSNRKRVQLAVSGLSLTRKCLLLLNPLHPISDLLSPRPTTASEIIMHLVDLVSAMSDDVFCLSKLGLVSRRLGRRADTWANRLWLLSTLIGLYKLHMTKLPKFRATLRSLPDVGGSDDSVAKQRREASRGLREAIWANRKYLADLVFVSYDIWDVQFCAEPIKCAAGLLAAYISTSKIYDSEWIASQGK